MAHIGQIVGKRLDKRREIDGAGFLDRRLLARESERRFGHLLHLIDRAQHLLAHLAVADEFGAQPQRSDRGTQIMADGGQHAGAIGDEAAQALLHAVEGLRGVADVLRPGFRQRLRRLAAAQRFGGNRHAAHRARDAARREDGDDRQSERGDNEGQYRLGCPETTHAGLAKAVFSQVPRLSSTARPTP